MNHWCSTPDAIASDTSTPDARRVSVVQLLKTCGAIWVPRGTTRCIACPLVRSILRPSLAQGGRFPFLLDLGNIPVDAISMPHAACDLSCLPAPVGISLEIVGFRDSNMPCFVSKLFMIEDMTVWLIQC